MSATTPVNNIRVVSCVHDTTTVIAGGKRRAPEGGADDDMDEKRMEAEMFFHETKWITTKVLFVSLLSMSVTLLDLLFQHEIHKSGNLCIYLSRILILIVFSLFSCFPTFVC
jgi:hypothetical protein